MLLKIKFCHFLMFQYLGLEAFVHIDFRQNLPHSHCWIGEVFEPHGIVRQRSE